MLLDDLKERNSSRVDDEGFGQYGENGINNNGERLTELCHQYSQNNERLVQT